MRATWTTGAALVGLLAACGGANDDHAAAQAQAPTGAAPLAPSAEGAAVTAAAPAPKLSMTDIEMAFEKKQVAAWSDAAQTAALYTPDAVLWYPGQEPLNGRDAIEKDHQGILDRYAGSQLADARMWLEGNTVITQWVMTGTDRSTSRPVSVSGVAVQTLNDEGLITKKHTYVDFETLMKQGGELEDRAPALALLPLPTSLEVHVAKNDATEATNAANLAASNAAWLKNDQKTFLGFVREDVVTQDFSGDGLPHDKKHLEQGGIAFRKHWEPTAAIDKNMVAVEEFTINEGEISIRQKSGARKSVTTHVLEVDQWKDGKVVKAWFWSNNLELEGQLGTGPAAPAPAVKTDKKVK